MKKVALITGGTSGLGFELAKNLANKGYFPIILGRNKERLDKAINDIRNLGFEVQGFQCDIIDEEALNIVLKELQKQYDKIDYLILNAGVVTVKLLKDYTNTMELKHDIENNLWGTILSAYTFLPFLKSGSKVIMISSGFGLMGAAAYTTYAASKAGIINFAEALKREVLHKNISVHVVCPGDIDTPQYHEEHRSMPDWLKAGHDSTPRGMMNPKVAADKILKRSKGNRFLVLINFEVKLLVFLTKILPRRTRDAILNRMFPRPSE